MSYGEYLKNTLRPLGIYELDTGIGAAELEIEGAAFDEIDGVLSDTLRNMLPLTADENGIERWSALLPYKPRGADLDAQRGSLMELIRSRENECSDQALNHVLENCCILAEVSETNVSETVKVTIYEIHLEDGEDERIKKQIEDILPCHLDIVYDYA